MRKPDFRLPTFPLGEEADAQNIAESIFEIFLQQSETCTERTRNSENRNARG